MTKSFLYVNLTFLTKLAISTIMAIMTFIAKIAECIIVLKQ